jgi:hypothetical protein
MSQFVKTIADVQLGVKVEADTNLAALEPFLQQAESEYIRSYLGEELMDAMAGVNYNSGKIAKVSKPLKIAVSCFAFYHLLQEGGLKINEHGAKQTISDRATPPPKWRDDNQKAELIRKGDRALDEVLDILLKNIEDFEEWKSSRWYALRTTLLIPNAVTFDQFVPIQKSTRVFLRLLPDLSKANRLLDSYICWQLPARLKDHLAEPETAEAAVEAITELMPYIQEVIAYETIVRAIPRFNFFNTPDGIIFYSINDSTVMKNVITHSEKKELVQVYKTKLEEAIASLKSYLGQHLTDFPEYANSTCSGQKVSFSPNYAFKNEPGQKYFAP